MAKLNVGHRWTHIVEQDISEWKNRFHMADANIVRANKALNMMMGEVKSTLMDAQTLPQVHRFSPTFRLEKIPTESLEFLEIEVLPSLFLFKLSIWNSHHIDLSRLGKSLRRSGSYSLLQPSRLWVQVMFTNVKETVYTCSDLQLEAPSKNTHNNNQLIWGKSGMLEIYKFKGYLNNTLSPIKNGNMKERGTFLQTSRLSKS